MRGRNLFRKNIVKTPSGNWRWTINSGWDDACVRCGKAHNYVTAKAMAVRAERELFDASARQGSTDLTSAVDAVLRATQTIAG